MLFRVLMQVRMQVAILQQNERVAQFRHSHRCFNLQTSQILLCDQIL